MILLGIDFGTARIGVALVDDRLGVGATPLTTVTAKGRGQAVEKLAALARQHGAETLVVGIPLAPDGGDRGVRAVQARNLARELETRTGLSTHCQDERDSSHEALERLIAAGVPMKKRAERVDEMAAAVILDRFVQSRQK